MNSGRRWLPPEIHDIEDARRKRIFLSKDETPESKEAAKNIALALLALLCLGLIDILFLYIWKTDIL